jgi:hypothetical protein
MLCRGCFNLSGRQIATAERAETTGVADDASKRWRVSASAIGA